MGMRSFVGKEGTVMILHENADTASRNTKGRVLDIDHSC